MKRWSLIAVLVVSSTAAADTKVPRPQAVRVDASATSSLDGFPPWRAINHATTAKLGWCGKAAGDVLTFTFDRAIPIMRIDVAGGIERGGKVVNEPAQIEITVGAQKQVLDGKGMQNAPLDGSPASSLSVKVVKGGTCISGVRITGPGTWYYGFVFGIDKAAWAALPGAAQKLEKALMSCDRGGLAETVAFPLQHEHEFVGMMTGHHEEATYKTVDDLVAACTRDGSVLARQYGALRFSDLADDIAHGSSQEPAVVSIGGEWELRLVGGAWKLRKIDSYDPEPGSVEQTFQSVFDSSRATLAKDAFVMIGDGRKMALPEGDHDREVGSFSRDGLAMLIALDMKIAGKPWRVTEVALRSHDEGEWTIVAGLWSQPRPNKEVNAAGAAGKLALPAPVSDKDDGDADVRAAFSGLLASGLDPAAAARKELISIGSGPGERTTSGAALAKPWAAAWAKKLAVRGGVVTRVLPTGRTAWAMADITLDKGKYKVPFRVFFVFDKTAAGAWSLVQAHFAVL